MLLLSFIVILTPVSSAFGQYGQNSRNTTAIMIDRCIDLGIDPSICSQEEILRKTRVCIPEMCDEQSVPDWRILIMILVLFGSGIGMSIGFAVWDRKRC